MTQRRQRLQVKMPDMFGMWQLKGLLPIRKSLRLEVDIDGHTVKAYHL